MAVFSNEWDAAETKEHKRESKARTGMKSQPRRARGAIDEGVGVDGQMLAT